MVRWPAQLLPACSSTTSPSTLTLATLISPTPSIAVRAKQSLLVSYLVFVARHPYLDLGIMKVAMLSNALSDANVSTW
jgi:hypothetical protein